MQEAKQSDAVNIYVLLKGALVGWLFLAFICYVFTHFLTFLMLSLPIYICSPWIIYNFQLKNLLQIAHFFFDYIGCNARTKTTLLKKRQLFENLFQVEIFIWICFFLFCLFVWVEFCYRVRVFSSNLKTESSLATCVTRLANLIEK